MKDDTDIPLDPLTRPTLGERAYERIAALLGSGQAAPGERLSLRDLASALDVSITPVREAVSRLVADGALEVARNRSVAVPLMGLARFRDLARVRIEIEGFAAAEAALRRDAASLETIRACERAFRAEAASPSDDRARPVLLNQQLHFAIYDAAGSATLCEIVRGLWLRVGPVINLDLRESPERLRTGGAVRFHGAALAAIEAGDPVAARTAIADDIAGAAAFIEAQGRLTD